MGLYEPDEAELRLIAERLRLHPRAAWAAILAVPTAVAGIYGMNFEFMPELHLRFAYPVTPAAIATMCPALYAGFKRSGWL